MKKELWLFMGLFFTFALLWNLCLPPFEGPDENAHWEYVRFVYYHWKIPVQKEGRLDVPGEGFQPPLYYFLTASFLKIFGVKPENISLQKNPRFGWKKGWEKLRYIHHGERCLSLHLARLVSLFIGLGTIFILWKASLLLFADIRERTLFLSFGTLIPQFIFMHGVLNNDSLGIFFSTLTLYLLTLYVLHPARKLIFLAGISLGFGFLSKMSCIFLLPLGIGTVILREKRSSIPSLFLFLLGLILVSGWYPVRNFLIYKDFTGIKAQSISSSACVVNRSIFSRYFFIQFPASVFTSFFAAFGWVSIKLPLLIYIFILLGCMLALTGIFFIIKERAFSSVFIFHLASFLLILFSFVYYNTRFNCPQGRCLYPAILSISTIFVKGYTYLKQKKPLIRKKIFIWSGICSLAVALLLGVFYVPFLKILYRLLSIWYNNSRPMYPFPYYTGKVDYLLWSLFIFLFSFSLGSWTLLFLLSFRCPSSPFLLFVIFNLFSFTHAFLNVTLFSWEKPAHPEIFLALSTLLFSFHWT